MVTLSILDQSPVAQGSNAKEALQRTVKLAQAAENLGYKRFWVSEHHDARSLAGSTPEVLIAHLAAMTKNIRVGSGGVMLPHYSAYKVAENFRMLEALYPNRIDLGVGRAPGGMPRATLALQEGRLQRADYPKQIDDLMAYITDTVPEDHRFPGLKATPLIDTVPEMWLLGSTNGSASIAAHKGTAFSFAQFINGDGGVEAVRAYKQHFKPSILLDKPKTSVAIFVYCAETDEKADLIASSLDLSLLFAANGQRSGGTPTIEMAQSYEYNSYERAFIQENRKRMIVGSPKTVKEKIESLAAAYDTDEIIAVTTTHQFEHRLRSYELLADTFGLKTRTIEK
ncbi:LLM class flavin-dependent oxidoreductase [Pueribacillus theae]|uniref:LLM class flavin-dependent oxidoreductase n=1 Tax=Pueribacillus theae TaxID=2171751 RepID=A0A2U1JK90_9BACI|nr:LLM class flavin-dependent oxidoreductase [Pueribacillus theae]PWA05308.1 LLM class flavin-dependent oxidoreductase [Pueribacillus theae]